MLQELASMGDPPVSSNADQWAQVQQDISSGVQEPDQLHLLAETVSPYRKPVGWAYARLRDLEPIYEPARVLHISALYVSRPSRRKGIGQVLLQDLLQWGRDSGCVEAELNVLVGNPARALYERCGFSATRIKMSCKL
jgi:GNAT superfamily N-acetyltransferase